MASPIPLVSLPVGPTLLSNPAWINLDWLMHGFSTRTGGRSTAYRLSPDALPELNLGFTPEDERSHVVANRESLLRACTPPTSKSAQLVTMRQVHSNVIHPVTCATGSAVPESPETGDGMMTSQPGLLLAIQTADCVPVLIVDEEHQAVAAFHAGWRGTVERIVEAGVARMQTEYGSRSEHLSAAIGPCIGACCYTVGEELRLQFAARFPYSEALFSRDREGKLHLDLVEANRQQLVAAGVSASNVHALHKCTSCHADQFFSYRKSAGLTGRMMSVIGISKNLKF